MGRGRPKEGGAPISPPPEPQGARAKTSLLSNVDLRRTGTGMTSICVLGGWGELPEDSKGLDTHCVGGWCCEPGQPAGPSWAAAFSWPAWSLGGPGAWGQEGPPGKGWEEDVRSG